MVKIKLMALLPYQKISYQTDLTPGQIQQRLSENVITGFSLWSDKPYYGSYSNYDFSVRKTYSRLKKQSISPTINGSYKASDSKTFITLIVVPHPVLIIGLFLFSFPLIMFMIAGLQEFIRTWDVVVLFNCFVPIFVLYGLFWGIFQYQSNASLRFWEHTLSLNPR